MNTLTPGSPNPAPPSKRRIHWRRAARVLAMQALCQLDSQGDDFLASIERFVDDRLAADDAVELCDSIHDLRDRARVRDEALRLAREAWRRRGELDAVLRTSMPNWDPDRLALVDRALLRLSLCELAGGSAAEPSVIIDEAIELARLFGGVDSPRFVNGVLDACRVRMKVERPCPEGGSACSPSFEPSADRIPPAPETSPSTSGVEQGR